LVYSARPFQTPGFTATILGISPFGRNDIPEQLQRLKRMRIVDEIDFTIHNPQFIIHNSIDFFVDLKALDAKKPWILTLAQD
jgi:hypothetical protein